jgi:propanol-preferring alcohol dehydrogenase
MYCMVLNSPKPVANSPLKWAEFPDPMPGSGQIRVRVHTCGVCHTDLHTVEGELIPPTYPVIPGHQVVGQVDKLGEGVTSWKIGDRVGLAWLHHACGHCEYCLRRQENLCQRIEFTGFHVPGGYAQYTIVHQGFAYAIPEDFSDRDAAPLLCAGIIGFRSFRLSNIQPGQRLGLYGFGAAAHICLQIAKHWNCQVYVFTRSEEHSKLALDLGAAWVGDAKSTPPKLLHSSIIFAPAGWLVPEALRVLDSGGTVALGGIHMSPIPELDYAKHLYHEKILRSVANSTRKDGEDLLKIAQEIPIRTQTELFPLSDANLVLQRLKAGAINGAAVLEIP